MKNDHYDTVETLVWFFGLTTFATGCGFQWGWPAALIAFGGLFAFWPLLKQFARR